MFIKTLEKLEQCIKKNALNYSSIREVVLKEIKNSNRGLCADEIHQSINKKVQKKVSHNTVYRVLRLFEECEIVITIQSNAKKAHYFLADSDTKLYIIDIDSHEVTALQSSKTAKTLLKENNLGDSNSFVVIHKK